MVKNLIKVDELNKYEKIMLLVECALLCLLVINIFRDVYRLSISADHMLEYSNSGQVEKFINDGEKYVCVENCGGETIYTHVFDKLRCGAYDVRVEYFSDFYYNLKDKSDEKEDLNKVVGVMEVGSEKVPKSVSSTTLLLKDGINEMVSTFWIEPGYRLYDLTLDVTFWGTGRLGIKSIDIEEKREYRVIYLLECILIIIILDFSYLLLKKGHNKRNKWILGCLVGCFVLSCLPITINIGKQGHDSAYHFARMMALAEGIANGQFPNRIEQSMLNGYGYAGALFYGEIFLYIPAILILLGIKVQNAYYIYIVIINLFTILIAYYCFIKMFKEDRIAVLGTLLYTCAPYRLVDVYTRVAVGEYTAWTFLPLIVYGFWILYGDKKKKLTVVDCWPIVIGISGILQSHILTCEMIIPFIVLFCLMYLKQTFKSRNIILLILSVLLIALINSFFLYPFLDSMSMPLKVFNDELNLIGAKGLGAMNIFIVLPSQGYRYFLGISFLIGIGGFVWCIMNKQKCIIEPKSEYKAGIIYFIFTIISIILTLRYFPYDRIASYSNILTEIIGMIQFPWRFLMFASLFGTLTICASVKMMPEKNQIKRNYLYVQSGIVIIIVLLMSANYDYDGENKIYTSSDIDMNNVGNGEYLLADTNMEVIYDNRIICSDDVICSDMEFDSGIYTVNIQNNNMDKEDVLLPIFAYDNYKAFDSVGNIIECYKGQDNKLAIDVPQNFKGEVCIEYVVPFSWRISEVVSLITIVIFMGFVIVCRVKNNAKRNRFTKGETSIRAR